MMAALLATNTFQASETCPHQKYAHPGACAATDAEASCTTSEDCPQGQICSGDAGCDTSWTCKPPRPCTRDLVTFCGCDGETFQSSSSCPGAQYRNVGQCQ